MPNTLTRPFSILASTATSGASSLSLTSAVTFPNTRVVVGDEVMLITGGNGTTTLSVSRGQEDSMAAEHPAGSRVTAYPIPDIQAVAADATRWYYGRKWTSCVVSWISSGGPEEARWSFAARAPYDDVLPPAGVQVEIRDDTDVIWLGRIEEPGADFFPNSGRASNVEIIARGYGSHAAAQRYLSEKKFAAGTSIASAIEMARNDLCPLISTTNTLVTATGRTLITESEDFAGQTAQDVFNSLVEMGSSTLQALLWAITGNGGTTPLLELRERPTTPVYFVTLRALEDAHVVWPMEPIKNRITVKFKGGQTSVSDATSQAVYPSGIGEIRDEYLDVSGQIDSHAMASAIAGTHLTRLADSRPVASHLSIPYTEPSEITDGVNPVAPWRLKEGSVIQITDLDTDVALLPADPVFMKRIEFDFGERRLSIETEDVTQLVDVVGKLIEERKELKFPPLPLFWAKQQLAVSIPFVFHGGTEALVAPMQPVSVPLFFSCQITHVDLLGIPGAGATTPEVIISIYASTLENFDTDIANETYTLVKTITGTPSNAGELLTDDCFFQLAPGAVLIAFLDSATETDVVTATARGLRGSGVSVPRPTPWVGTESKELSPCDVDGPVITDVAALDETDTEITISFTTDEPGDTRIDYGIDPDFGGEEYGSEYVTEHSITFGGLEPATTYWFAVGSKDESGNLTTDDGAGTYYFTTLAG